MATGGGLFLVSSLLVALGVGFAAARFGTFGGPIFAALIFGTVVASGFEHPPLPSGLQSALIILLGAILGAQVTRSTLFHLRPIAIPAVVSGVLLVGTGALLGYSLQARDLVSGSVMLATSPGALSVIAAAAIEQDLDVSLVAMFGTVRMAFVLLTIPLLLRGLRPINRTVEGLARFADAAAQSQAGVIQNGTWRQRAALLAIVIAAAVFVEVGSVLAPPIPNFMLAFMGAAVMSLIMTCRTSDFPPALFIAVQAGIGWATGLRVRLDEVQGAGPLIAYALVSAMLLSAAGFGIVCVLRRFGRSPDGDTLSTAPGALEVLVTIAPEHGRSALEVSLFHLVRMIVVIASIPMLLALAR